MKYVPHGKENTCRPMEKFGTISGKADGQRRYRTRRNANTHEKKWVLINDEMHEKKWVLI